MPKTSWLLAPTFALIWLRYGCSSCKAKSRAPGESWPSAPPETQGVDSEVLAQVVEQIGEEDLPIDSLLVVRNGVPTSSFVIS